MAADTTRMLVLGATRIFEPANGYQLRRELLSWDVDSWANVQPGSIYSMLTTLAKQGLVERIDLVTTPGARAVAVYRTTEAGRAELLAMVRAGVVEVRAMDTTEFYAAMSLVTGFFSREDMLGMLEERERNLRATIDGMHAKVADLEGYRGAPPHVVELMRFAIAEREAELTWMHGFVAQVRRGELAFLGERAWEEFQPADDDPAWRMVGERETYLQAMERQGL